MFHLALDHFVIVGAILRRLRFRLVLRHIKQIGHFEFLGTMLMVYHLTIDYFQDRWTYASCISFRSFCDREILLLAVTSRQFKKLT